MINPSRPSLPSPICSSKASSLANSPSLPPESLLKKIYGIGLRILNIAFSLISTVFYVLKGRVSSTTPPSPEEVIITKLIQLESIRQEAERVRVSVSSGKRVVELAATPHKSLETLKGLNQAERIAIKEIDLSGLNLTTFPPELFLLPNLERLNLSNNKITAIPLEIRSLTKLKELDLSHNVIKDIPDEITDLPEFMSLNIAHNNLSTIPPKILEDLLFIDFSGNQYHADFLYVDAINLVKAFSKHGFFDRRKITKAERRACFENVVSLVQDDFRYRKVYSFIQNYNITDERVRIEIANFFAQKQSDMISEFIQDYNITDEQTRIEFAKTATQRTYEVRVSEFIQNYNITNEQARIEIAKVAAQRSPKSLSQFIKNYNITDEQARIEIAKIAAQRSPESLSQFIENYNITDEQARIEIAKIAAQQQYVGWFSRFIQNYHITDEQARIEIAKIATQNGSVSFIENYHITNEQARIEIAKIAAQRNPGLISRFIENYHITDEQARIEIAKTAAQNDPDTFAWCIENYHITDEQARIELVKIIAQNRPMALYGNIKRYKITNEKVRIELAKLGAQKSPEKFTLYIEDYDITDEKVRIELAKFVAQKDGKLIAMHIGNYHITRERDRLDILKRAIRQNPDLLDQCLVSRSTILSTFNLSSRTYPIMNIIANIPEEGYVNPEVIRSIKTLLMEEEDPLFASILTELDKIKLPDDQKKVKERLKWLFYTCLQLTDSTTQFLEDPSLLAKIFKHPDPQMRYQLVNAALDIFNDPDKTAAYHAFVEEREYLKLPALLLFQTGALPICQILKEPLMKAKDFLKDGPFIKSFLNIIYLLLMNTPELSRQEAIFLIRQTLILPEEEEQINAIQAQLTRQGITREEGLVLKRESDKVWTQIKANLRNKHLTIQSIIECGKVNQLKLAIPIEFSGIKERPIRSSSKPPSFNLYRILETMLNESIKIQGIENLGHKLAEKFKNNVAALIAYASNLNNFIDLTKQKKALDALNIYIRSVLEGNFKAIRYATEHSEHLRDVFASRAGLKELWVENQEVDLSIFLGPAFRGWSCENADHFDDLLLCGTVVRNSCQAINRELRHNKGLLAYLLDGKIRLFSIKDENGNIIARAICRLLWDSEKGQPALMMENMYWKGEPDSELKEALIKFTKLQAARLEIPLFEDAGKYSPSKSKLESRGGRAPWEYVDSAGEEHDMSSIYTISQARMIYDPKEASLSSQI